MSLTTPCFLAGGISQTLTSSLTIKSSNAVAVSARYVEEEIRVASASWAVKVILRSLVLTAARLEFIASQDHHLPCLHSSQRVPEWCLRTYPLRCGLRGQGWPSHVQFCSPKSSSQYLLVTGACQCCPNEGGPTFIPSLTPGDHFTLWKKALGSDLSTLCLLLLQSAVCRPLWINYRNSKNFRLLKSMGKSLLIVKFRSFSFLFFF